MGERLYMTARYMSHPEQLPGLQPSTELASHDQMHTQDWHYYGVGMSALWALQAVTRARMGIRADLEFPRRVLDFGCGCGRVTRWLRQGFPQADIHVTDLRQADVQWCVDNFGCKPLDVQLDSTQFDLIWVGSVFTHLAEGAARDLLAALLSSLAEDVVI
jgi:2-polyprenyl-3-methyl-5-hydroxy-6-metoxy-1,4-benzoquinol methylase